MVNNRIALAILLISLGFAGACSNVEVPDLDADVKEEGIIPEGWQPLELRVGLAPFRSALELDDKRYNVEDTRRWVLVPDEERLNGPDGLHRQMLQTLRTYRMFERIEPIDGATPDTPRDELQASALNQGLDVVIVPTLRRQDVGYVDSNGAYGWNMFIWWMVSPIISWWVADEDFDAHLHVDLRLYPTTGDVELHSHRLQPPETIVRSLDDWDEGWNLFSIYSTPGHFDEENWTRIGNLLMPIAENEARKSALRYVAGELATQSRNEGFLRGIRRRVALVVGVDGTGQPPVPLSRYAVDDANALAVQFEDARNGGVHTAALRTVTGPRANRRGVMQAADELAKLARYNDDVYFVYTGVGALTEDNKPAIVLAQSGGGSELVPVEDVLDRLMANAPRTVTLVLDCSFTAPGDKRCATSQEQIDALVESGRDGNLLEPLIAKCNRQGTSCIVLSATEPVVNPHTMPALEIEDLSHGLFTSYALQGLAGDADANRNRLVTVAEFEEYVREKVTQIAELEGAPQTGWFYYPEDRKDFVLPSWRR